MTLDQFVLDYLRTRLALPDDLRAAATIAGFDTRGKYELTSDNFSVIPFLSQNFAETLLRLWRHRQLRVYITNPLDYLSANPCQPVNISLVPVRLSAVT